MATVTITTPAGQDSRIAAAFGARLGLPGSASAAQIKGDIAKFMRRVVRDHEEMQASIAAQGGVTDITPT